MPSQTVDRRRGVQSGCIIHSELLILRRHEIPPKQLIEFKQRCSDGYRENSFVEELNKKSAPCPDCNPIENIIPEVGQWAAMWTASYIPLLLSTLFVLFQYTMTVDAVSKKKKNSWFMERMGSFAYVIWHIPKGKNMYFKDINITHGHDCIGIIPEGKEIKEIPPAAVKIRREWPTTHASSRHEFFYIFSCRNPKQNGESKFYTSRSIRAWPFDRELHLRIIRILDIVGSNEQ